MRKKPRDMSGPLKIKRCQGPLGESRWAMPSETRVKLIFDPYRICTAGGCRVTDLGSERLAFREIEGLLRKDAKFETIRPKTYVIEGQCWEHFQTYRGVKGVLVE